MHDHTHSSDASSQRIGWAFALNVGFTIIEFIAHAMYLQYVDVFRADRAMTHLFRSVGDKYQTKVIRTLKELVSELNKIVPN